MDFAFIILYILLFLFSVYIGFLLGTAAGERAVTTVDYWKMNVAAIIIAVLLSFVLSGLPLLSAAIVGLLAGGIMGLKMAFGESTGPWKWLDRVLNVNRAHRETAERGTGEQRRQRKRDGGKAPDLISVKESPKGAPQGAKNTQDRKNTR